MRDISEISFVPELKLASLDISDMYSNIPTDELENIIYKLCKQQSLEDTLTREILAITRTILTQSYFSFKGKTYLQKKGQAMDAPTSSILCEIYLQHLENTRIFNILRNSGIEGYFRYVDDILLIYNKNRRDIGEIVHSNDLTPSLNFTLEREVDNKLNFLDISIIKTADRISSDIYRKPATSDVIIPNDSCHPQEQKMAAIRYFQNRINTYDINDTRKHVELDKIKQIIHNNRYDTSILDKVNHAKPKHKHDNQKEKWAKFTYVGRETGQINKLFTNTKLKVAGTTNNNLGKLLHNNVTEKTDKYGKSGVYQLNCPTCNKKYIGQTGRPFRVRFREHLNDYKHMYNKSKFAQHLLNEGHNFGPMEDIMDVIQFAKKGKMLDTLERFYIYEATHKGIQINDKLTVQKNPIFETLVQHHTHRERHQT